MVMFILLAKFSSMASRIEGSHLYGGICLLGLSRSRRGSIGSVMRLILSGALGEWGWGVVIVKGIIVVKGTIVVNLIIFIARLRAI